MGKMHNYAFTSKDNYVIFEQTIEIYLPVYIEYQFYSIYLLGLYTLSISIINCW